MRPVTTRLGLFFCICATPISFAGDGDQKSWLSPNRSFWISTAPSAERERYSGGLVRVELREASNHVVGSYDPEARGIEVLWSPDSRFVAINEDFSHATCCLSVWHLVNHGWAAVRLPEQLQNRNIEDPRTHTSHGQDAISRLLPTEVARLIMYWCGAYQPDAVRWLNQSDLEVSTGGEAELKDKRHLIADYRFIVHCSKGGTAKIVDQKRVRYEIQESKK